MRGSAFYEDFGEGFAGYEMDEDRSAFFRRVYTWFGAAVLTAALAGGAVGMFPAVGVWAVKNYMMLYLLELGLLIGSWFLLERSPINVVVLMAFAAVTGMVIGVSGLKFAALGQPQILGQAGTITAMTFGGLTFYAWTSQRDFSFMRGFLDTGVWTLFGIGIVFFVFGIPMGNVMHLAFGAIGSLLGAGYILYITGNIIHHYEEGEEVAAAFALYWSVFYLMWHLMQFLFALARE